MGTYRIASVLGQGGMGVVYLAHTQSGDPVALKVIRADLASDPQFRSRFRREVAAASRVGGRFTASVLDSDPDAEEAWLATEYIPGPTLHEAVTRGGPLGPDPLHGLAAGLAEALLAIHEAGVVHRDLTPNNVLLAADGPRVIDFGIARAVDAASLTTTGLFVGTPSWMSPELARGQAVGPPSDVFSWGAVVAFAGTGSPPFGAGPFEAMIYRVVHEAPQLEGLPADLHQLVLAALAKDPAARPGAQGLIQELSGEPLDGDPHAAATAVIERTWVFDLAPLTVAIVPSAGPPRQQARRVRNAVLAVLLIAGAAAGGAVAAKRNGDGQARVPEPGPQATASANPSPQLTVTTGTTGASAIVPTTISPPVTSLVDGMCARYFAAVAKMTGDERRELGNLPRSPVRIDPENPDGLQIIGIPFDSETGDAYDYRWNEEDGLQLSGPFSSLESMDEFPIALERERPGAKPECVAN